MSFVLIITHYLHEQICNKMRTVRNLKESSYFYKPQITQFRIKG